MTGGAGPDLLGVCEVENAYVLGLLRDALAPLGRDYHIAHADTADQRGIDVAFLYDGDRYQVRDGEIFSHFVLRRTATRDLFQVNFRTKPARRLLVAIGNHWPSRRGGELESAAYRAMAGETLAYFHDRIREIHGKDAAVIAMGDFNDEPSDTSLTDYTLSERQARKVLNAKTPRLLNLMWPALGAAIGTYYFNSQANVLDQFLINKGLLTGELGLKARLEVVSRTAAATAHPSARARHAACTRHPCRASVAPIATPSQDQGAIAYFESGELRLPLTSRALHGHPWPRQAPRRSLAPSQGDGRTASLPCFIAALTRTS